MLLSLWSLNAVLLGRNIISINAWSMKENICVYLQLSCITPLLKCKCIDRLLLDGRVWENYDFSSCDPPSTHICVVSQWYFDDSEYGNMCWHISFWSLGETHGRTYLLILFSSCQVGLGVGLSHSRKHLIGQKWWVISIFGLFSQKRMNF